MYAIRSYYARRLVMGGQGIDDFVDIPLHDPLQAIQGQPDAMIGATSLGKVVGADTLAASYNFV